MQFYETFYVADEAPPCGVCCAEEGVKIGAGGAVTILSDPADEWEEMELKASALVNCAHAVAAASVAPTSPSGVSGGAAGGDMTAELAAAPA